MVSVKGVYKAMQLARLRSLLFLIFTVAIAGAIAGCDNPFDPLKSSDKIQGLSYFDFSATQEHWDSDPEWDGLQLTLSYFNEFGDGLNFHDKTSKIQVELWSDVAGATAAEPATRTFLTSFTVTFSNSDDPIRIPIESYVGFLEITDPPTDIKGCLQVRLFPPQEYPQKVLVAPFQCAVPLYNKEAAVSPL
jgi:hypothetical protein